MTPTSCVVAILFTSLAVAAKRIEMRKRWITSLTIAVTICFLALVSTVVTGAATNAKAEVTGNLSIQSEVPRSRLARLRHGINLSHWFAQSADYSKAHLETHTTEKDIALIKKIGFDHVRLTLDPTPLFNRDNPESLSVDYLPYLDHAVDQILAAGLAVIVDIHPSDEFKKWLNGDDHHIEAFGRFWLKLSQHLSSRDPERLFFEAINEPMIEDGYRWFGIQGKLISAIRAGAPRHTIIASGHRWSGLPELLFLSPYADRNIIYNFHFYEPFAFTHQGATWGGPNVPFYKNVPYPSTPESISKILDTIENEPARKELARYGEGRWDAMRIDHEIGLAAEWAGKYNVPLTCNEFGTYRKFASAADRISWVRDMRVAMEKYGIGWTMWDYGGDFGVVNKENGIATADEDVVRALGLRRK